MTVCTIRAGCSGTTTAERPTIVTLAERRPTLLARLLIGA